MHSCLTSRYVPDCKGEGECGFAGLPHLICVPIPPYADRLENAERRAVHEARAGRAGEALVPT